MLVMLSAASGGGGGGKGEVVWRGACEVFVDPTLAADRSDSIRSIRIIAGEVGEVEDSAASDSHYHPRMKFPFFATTVRKEPSSEPDRRLPFQFRNDKYPCKHQEITELRSIDQEDYLKCLRFFRVRNEGASTPVRGPDAFNGFKARATDIIRPHALFGAGLTASSNGRKYPSGVSPDAPLCNLPHEVAHRSPRCPDLQRFIIIIIIIIICKRTYTSLEFSISIKILTLLLGSFDDESCRKEEIKSFVCLEKCIKAKPDPQFNISIFKLVTGTASASLPQFH
uniref:Uncharacterized protein n=1 Tax=Salix viminalis TaxID=40686 RepID=A0A6N2LVD0_SALVM